MSKEHVSILLEVISFFFVTTDLYGKERLENLNQIIAERRLTGKIYVKNFRLLFNLVLLIAFIYIVYEDWSSWMKNLRVDLIDDRHFKEFDIIDWLKYIGTAILIIIGSLGVVVGLIYISSWVFTAIFYTSTFILFFVLQVLLQIVSMKGLLIVVGSILFVISKILRWR
jgi:hypothetical protein